MRNCFVIWLLLLSYVSPLHAQEAASAHLADSGWQKPMLQVHSTRVINGHSTEMLGKGVFDFRILHRFEPVNTGIEEFYGFDHASMRLSLDYGITRNIMAGFGRSTLHKEFDAFVKGRLMQQSPEGKASRPLSLVVAVGGSYVTASSSVPLDFSDRSSYYFQFIAGRTFGSRLSLQADPIFVHRHSLVNSSADYDVFAAGIAGRYSLSKRVGFTFEYHHIFSDLDPVYTDPFSTGFDIETGGHIFQLHFSNAVGMNERTYLTETTGQFFKGSIRFGFNLSRTFSFHKTSS